MKIGRNGLELTTANKTLSSDALVQQFEKIRDVMDNSYVDAENFAISEDRFFSDYIQNVTDAVTASKYFEGQFFDINENSEADKFFEKNLTISELLDDFEETVSTVNFRYFYSLDADDIDISEEDFFNTGHIDLVNLKISMSQGDPVSGALGHAATKYAPIVRDLHEQYFTQPVTEFANDLVDSLKSFGNFLGFGSKRKRDPETVVSRKKVVIQIPLGYEYVEHSIYGRWRVKLTSKTAKPILKLTRSDKEFVEFTPMIKLDDKIVADEYCIWNGVVSVKMRRKI